jgi:hypothetical protein
MVPKIVAELLLASLLVSLLAPFEFTCLPVSAHPPLDATPVSDDFKNPRFLKDPCPADPNNLLHNAAMDPGRDTQFGSVVDAWEPFVFSGTPPQFRWVNNEGIYRSQSQQIFSTNVFDAGIYQVVHNLQPGTYYWFRLGWAPAAKSYDGPNVESSAVGRKVGVDPFGGTDPKSPNVIWGPDYFGDIKGLNRPQLILLFAARSPDVTIFMRAIAREGSGGENRVWFNAPCMEARPDLLTATPLPPTATPVPPTATARPTQTRAPATKVAAAPSPTNTLPPVADTPTPSATATPTTTPRYARPEVTPAPAPMVSLNADALTGLGTVFVVGALAFWGIGILLWRGQSR